ncbi:MAG: hypothetical protein GYA60_01535 [Candidatus Methanofastidiosa archaeon]|nr:hypothetical protein [Candidatus Methanofastidiosa archaeon]
MEEVEEIFDKETSVSNNAFKCKICGNSYLYAEEYDKAYSKMEKAEEEKTILKVIAGLIGLGVGLGIIKKLKK